MVEIPPPHLEAPHLDVGRLSGVEGCFTSKLGGGASE